MIVLFISFISYAQDSAPPVTIPDTPPAQEAPADDTQMAQSRQIVDCLVVFLEDQIAAKEKKLEWKQPEMAVYEKVGCLSQLPVAKAVVTNDKKTPL